MQSILHNVPQSYSINLSIYRHSKTPQFNKRNRYPIYLYPLLFELLASSPPLANIRIVGALISLPSSRMKILIIIREPRLNLANPTRTSHGVWNTRYPRAILARVRSYPSLRWYYRDWPRLLLSLAISPFLLVPFVSSLSHRLSPRFSNPPITPAAAKCDPLRVMECANYNICWIIGGRLAAPAYAATRRTGCILYVYTGARKTGLWNILGFTVYFLLVY